MRPLLRLALTAPTTALTAALLFACAPKPQPETAKAIPVSQRQSTVKDRSQVALTIYNDNFALVREVRKVALSKGRIALSFENVAKRVQPETVLIRSLSRPDGLQVLEQNYRYDLLTPQKLLEKHVGKRVRLYRYNRKLGREEVVEATVLSHQGGAVFKIGDEISSGFKGRIAFPSVPSGLMAKPTLVWLLDSQAERQALEVSYLTKGIGWKADYVLVLGEDESRGDLNGWVTLNNESGANYRGAKLKLVAGDVQRVGPNTKPTDIMEVMNQAARADDDAGFREEGFFEYHLYTLGRATDVMDKEQKQVSLLQAQGVAITKKLIFYGQPQHFRSRSGQVQSSQKVGVYLDFDNSQASGLGMPLPKGIVRVYKADESGSKQLIGEDRIDHTPRDEKIRIKMGEAFDVVAERKQTSFVRLSGCVTESAWQVSLRNHKDEPVTVRVVEPIVADWKVLESSHPARERDSKSFSFEAPVPARGETKLTYTVRVRWC